MPRGGYGGWLGSPEIVNVDVMAGRGRVTIVGQKLRARGESISPLQRQGDLMANPASALPNPNEKLVKVFDSEQESEALVVKGLLDSAGIDADMTSVDAVQDMFPGVGGTVILVREEDADAARRLIDDYRQPPDADETQEIDLNEDKPTAG